MTAGQFIAVADITAGKLKFSPAANANGTPYTTFTFQVQDNGGTTNGGVDLDQSANTITVNVTSVNDAPAGADKTITINEDNGYTLVAADFGFSDTSDSPANALAAVKITTVATHGTLSDDGTAVTAGQLIPLADITGNKLTFSPAANANGSPYATFTFQVQDNGGIANGGVDLDQSANTITVNVTSVNDAPAGTDKTVTTDEDTAYTLQTADFGFSDTNDSPANNLAAVKITTLPGTGTLKNDGSAVTPGQLVSAADIGAGKLIFSPAANANGTPYATLTFQVKDDGGTANGGVDLDQFANTITVNVDSVNDAPAGADNTVTATEDTSYPLTTSDFGFSDPNDSPANSLQSVKIASLPANGTLKNNGTAITLGVNDEISAADITAGKLTFSPAANANGSPYATFTFQVRDDGGTAHSAASIWTRARTRSPSMSSRSTTSRRLPRRPTRWRSTRIRRADRRAQRHRRRDPCWRI